MILQPCLHSYHKVSLSSSISYSQLFTCKIPTYTLHQTVKSQKLPVIICSMSQIHSYGTVDYDRRPMVKWKDIFRKISLMENPELGSDSVLNEWEKGGRKLTKWELSRVVKELRKFRRYKQALEVYDWMNNRGEERFRSSASDGAIQLDLIAKVRGVASAEDFFLNLPDTLKDRRVYGALLNAYVGARMKGNAELLFEKMRDKGYAVQSLPFNVMMTLYMNLKEYDKVDLVVSEMKEKGIRLDIYSYNICLSSCGSQGSAEKMEEVFEQMKVDKIVNPNWTTFSTMATMYIKMGQIEKADECLRRVESRITGRDRIPYHYLLSLYAGVGKKEEVYRVWNLYKSIFPSITNSGHHAMISSLARTGDVEGMEKIYEEWLSVKSSYDPRITNLMMGCYVKEGNFYKAETLFNNMIEEGGKPNSTSWETLAEGHIGEKRILEALSCFKEAFAAEGAKNWRPKPINVTSFFKVCEEEPDTESKEALVALLRQPGYRNEKDYMSLIGLTNEAVAGNNKENDEDNDDENSEMLLSQLQFPE